MSYFGGKAFLLVEYQSWMNVISVNNQNVKPRIIVHLK